MKLKLYNTESRKKEEIEPLEGNTINMYTCGPTIYDYAHVGNFRTYLFEDILRRTIKYFGMEVNQVMNITDVDDKTIKASLAKNMSLFEYTEPFRQAFFEDLNALNVEQAEYYPRATQYIDMVIEIISDLLEKKIAYIANNKSVYFAIDKCKDYGRLSHLNLEELQKTSNVSSDEYGKENVADFVIWKAYDEKRDGEVFWESPFGKGRPGWHIECSAMALKLLSQTIDIHCGGVDNIFPHHENEIAQSEAFTNKKFVNHWAHSEHLIVDGKKMSKSLGNFFTLRDLLKMGYNGREIRYMLISSHYRTQFNFTFEGLKAARASLARIDDLVLRLQDIDNGLYYGDVEPILERFEKEFKEALADDLNMPICFAKIFDFVREINTLLDKNLIGNKESGEILNCLNRIDFVLKVIFVKEEETIPETVIEAFKKRQEARKCKNWVVADELRDYISEQGYIIEDLGDKARLKKK